MIDSNRDITVMGIVNLTDNSYYPASRMLNAEGLPDIPSIIDTVGRMIEEGTGIIDIGACSTRPGSDPVGEEEEWRRLCPVIKAIRKEFPKVPVSIDTYWASVVQRAFDTIGTFYANDISAGEDDPLMLSTVGKLGLPYIAMHKRGTPKTMQSLCEYEDVTDNIVQYFRDFEKKAADAGIKDWILDPGFGFAKTIDQNYELLKNMERFEEFGRKTLVGISRKSMIYRLFGITPEEALPQTQVLHFEALRKGADILRVHDVAEAVRTITIYRKLASI